MAIRRIIAIVSVVLAASAFAARETRADFQALGVVATKQPASMQCQGGLCTAYLSAFCLEKNHPPPPSRTTYRPAENTKITLIVETATGGSLRLPWNGWLRFETRTNYTGVLAIVDKRRLGKMDPVKMSLEVGAMASLLPVDTTGGGEPHSAEEIALATGPYRQAAQHYFENNAAGTQAVSFAAGLINALPPSGNLSEDRLGAIVTAVRAEFDISNASLETRAEADRIVGVCHVRFPRRWHMSMRLCVEHEHGALQVRTNNRFWNSLGGV
jgi:hypothetical protein